MEDMTLNSAANAEVNVNESTSVNENVSAVTDTPTILPESPVIGFQAVDAEGNVLGFVSKADLVNEAKQALYADLAILEANRPTTLPANEMLADTSTLAATDVYEDQLAIKSDAPYIRGLDASGNPIRISKADLASVVGELIGSATLGIRNGLMPKSVGYRTMTIKNTYIKISMESLYNSLTLSVSMFDGGEVGLFLLSVSLVQNKYCKCGLIGNKRTTRFYVKDKYVYIATTSTTNCHYSISSFSLNSQIVSVDDIPRQEFDDSYYEIPISPII